MDNFPFEPEAIGDFDSLQSFADLSEGDNEFSESFFATYEQRYDNATKGLPASELHLKNDQIRKVNELKERALSKRLLVEKRLQAIDSLTGKQTSNSQCQLIFAMGKVMSILLNSLNSSADEISALLISLHSNLEQYEHSISASVFDSLFLVLGESLAVLAEKTLKQEDCFDRQLKKLKKERNDIVWDLERKNNTANKGASNVRLDHSDRLFAEVNSGYDAPSTSISFTNHDEQHLFDSFDVIEMKPDPFLSDKYYNKQLPVTPSPPRKRRSSTKASGRLAPKRRSERLKKDNWTEAVELEMEVLNTEDSPPRDSFECSSCSESFGDITAMQKHGEIMHGKLRKSSTPFVSGLTKKMIEHEKNVLNAELPTVQDSLDCSFCSKSFDDLGSMQKHEEIMHGKLRKSFIPSVSICTFCDKLFVSSKLRLEHIISDHEKERKRALECDVCPPGSSILKSLFELGEHKKTHNRDENLKRSMKDSYGCTACKLECHDIHSLSVHAMSVHGKKTFLIDCCLTFGHTTAELLEHRRKHILRHDDSTFSCEPCHINYASQQSVIMHMATRHKIKFIPSGVTQSVQATGENSSKFPVPRISSGTFQLPVRVLSVYPPQDSSLPIPVVRATIQSNQFTQYAYEASSSLYHHSQGGNVVMQQK